MALLKLYRGVAAPAAEVGKIWFDVENQVIKVYNGTDWEVYGTTPADLAALAERVTVLEGAVKTLNEATLPALKEELEQAIAEAVAAEAEIARAAEEALGKRIDAVVAASVSVAEKTDGHVTVSKSTDETTGAVVYTIAENDIASAQGLADEISRATGEEARIEGLVNTEKGRAEGIEAGLETRLAAVEADYLKAADKTELSDAIASEKTRAEGKEAELLAAIEAEAATARAAEKANADAIAVEKGRLDTFLADADVTEKAVDTLKEIQTYINEHGEAAAKMVENIAANAAAIEAEVTRATTAEGNLQTAITNEVTAREAGDADTLAAAKKYTDDSIALLDATVGSQTVEEGKHVAVEVVETDGKLTGLTVVESDIASAAALATLDAEVQEHEVVVSAALNDLNARVDGHATRLDELEAGLGAVEHTTVSDGDSADFVAITETTEGSHKNYAVSATVVKGANGDDAGLATDAYVREQIAAAAMVWEEGSF
jgi:hypothetical protein